jgi:hypothetical protein
MMAGETIATAQPTASGIEEMAMRAEREAMGRAASDDEVGKKRKFVAASTSAGSGKMAAVQREGDGRAPSRANPDEIDIDDLDDDAAGDAENQTGLLQKPVPMAVFGSVASSTGR